MKESKLKRALYIFDSQYGYLVFFVDDVIEESVNSLFFTDYDNFLYYKICIYYYSNMLLEIVHEKKRKFI